MKKYKLNMLTFGFVLTLNLICMSKVDAQSTHSWLPEKIPKNIWSWAIAWSCDCNNGFYCQEVPFYPENYLDIKDGDVVWIPIEGQFFADGVFRSLTDSPVSQFVREVLPNINVRFVLVTGGSDHCVPSQIGVDAESLLEDDRIIHWYTQNYDGSVKNDKLSPIPIGIDLQKWMREIPCTGQFRDMQQIAHAREQTLNSLIKSLKATKKRKKQIYIDFQFNDSILLNPKVLGIAGMGRQELFHFLADNKGDLIYTQTTSRFDFWQRENFRG